jgi:YHS domain-containing protein
MDNTIRDLQPGDRIALWVVMKPPVLDPVCGMTYREGFSTIPYAGREYVFCSNKCIDTFNKNPEKYKDRSSIKGIYNLAFYDTKTNRPVLSVPIFFKGKEESADAGEHHH